MSDLAHLYAKYVEWSDHSYGDYDDAVHDYIKALRAEVERLRAALRSVRDTTSSTTVYHIARAALGEEAQDG